MMKERWLKRLPTRWKSLPMSPCRPGRDGVPVTYSGAGSQP
jgi:hypothetical protein